MIISGSRTMVFFSLHDSWDAPAHTPKCSANHLRHSIDLVCPKTWYPTGVTMASWNIPKKIILRYVVMLYLIFSMYAITFYYIPALTSCLPPQSSNTLSNLMLKSAKSDPSVFFLVSNQRHLPHFLVGGFSPPLWKIWKSNGSIIPNWMDINHSCSSHHQPVLHPNLHPPTSIWRQATRTSKHTPTTSARNRPRRRPAAKQPTMRLTMAASTLSSEDFGCNDFKGTMDPIHLWIYIYINNHPLYSI